MQPTIVCLTLLCWAVCIPAVWGSPSRHNRVWPISGDQNIDLKQSSAYGPRLLVSGSYRYDFHRGVDIPVDTGTNVYAIDDGQVRLAGEYSFYSDPVIQLKHTGWDESPGTIFYSNYQHMSEWFVEEDKDVSKGQLIGKSGASGNGFQHLHFEIRQGGYRQQQSCNPWKYLPNVDNDYSEFKAQVIVTPNYNGRACQAVVNVTIPPDQLTFNRVELHYDTGMAIGNRVYDMCEANWEYGHPIMDDSTFEDDLYVSVARFNTRSYDLGELERYGFEFVNLPPTQAENGGYVWARVMDVFDNTLLAFAGSLYECP